MDDFCYLAHATGQDLLSVQEHIPQVHMGLTLPQVVTGNPQQNRQVPPIVTTLMEWVISAGR